MLRCFWAPAQKNERKRRCRLKGQVRFLSSDIVAFWSPPIGKVALVLSTILYINLHKWGSNRLPIDEPLSSASADLDIWGELSLPSSDRFLLVHSSPPLFFSCLGVFIRILFLLCVVLYSAYLYLSIILSQNSILDILTIALQPHFPPRD